ncbi:MAG: ABC transporter ATP-binding protein [Acidimicrobiales bacterium]
MTGLLVDQVSIRYGSAVALDRFSLETAKGEIVAVLGPSGSGKSTLLRAVAGLEPLAEGRIVLHGRDLAGVATHRRGLGLMFQDHGLFTHLSVADNIAYGLKTAGVPKPEREARVAELLDLVGLAGFGDRRTGQLSGGEAQRVALARALAPNPGLLMLDEPLGSLDRALREQLTGDLRRLLTELGQTALHVTHDQSEAFAVADRVVVVDDGKPVAIGTPAQLWDNPGSRFVAEFLGHPNIWTVSVAADGVVSWAGNVLGALHEDHSLRQVSADQASQLAVMPASGLQLIEAGGDQGPGRIEAQATDIVFRQGLFDVTAVAGENDTQLQFTTAQAVQPGQRVTLAVDAEALRLVQ